ncbi:DUF3732 domain-containing protein [Streptomyces sp. DT2A-34]|uniref:DUF3732 domain-containing protein n=1 Tax=Streptomyces sp. DT2A-34 TaxID=3051182 RepID=UPI00265B94AA|nr:DUF3732 domain-containing protein [Streptomyces sp. DT2A-34]MDO0917834.1 DUF3732 domain-containing protein [Streptomyces sp. DT2A-34]
MHLLALALYHRDGRPTPRVLRFKPGKLNIVTGWSKTGKTTLVDVVDHCLGRRRTPLPQGLITDTVGWFALLIQTGTSRVLVARRHPRTGSTSDAMLVFGDHRLDVPTADQLRVNSNTESIRSEISGRLGIEDHLIDSPDGSAYNVHIGHALPLCLQRQTEIADSGRLFHRQTDHEIFTALKNSLPYFLGAAGPEQAARKQQLLTTTRRLTALRRTLDQARQHASSSTTVRTALARLAHQAGLIAELPASLQPAELETLLHTALEAPSHIPTPRAEPGLADRLSAERRTLTHDLGEIDDALRLLDLWAQQTVDLTGQLHTQRSRLTPLGLLATRDDGHDTCPLCTQELPEADPAVNALSQLARDLEQELTDLDALAPAREQRRRTLTAEREQLVRRVRENAAAERALRDNNRALRRAQDQREQQALVRGRILQALHEPAADDTVDVSALRREITRLEEHRRDLQHHVDQDDIAAETEIRLGDVARNMTAWARELGLEHADTADDVRISPTTLNVVVRTSGRRIPLDQIGSADNWIGYHIVAHLALHLYFVEHQRPVPHFIMFDQPSQAFFPEEHVHDAATLEDADWQAVRAYYHLMHKVVAQAEGRLQVIATDHAHLASTPWFRHAVVANWRDGDALVPAHWLAH